MSINFYESAFYLLSTVCLILFIIYRPKPASNQNFNGKEEVIEYESHKKLTRLHVKYLFLYCLATLGDWLQGPYLYALYQSYGLTRNDIQLLFLAGFTSSMITGPIMGSMADRLGRRLNCILYCIFYTFCCVSQQFSDIKVLFMGRIFGGISTSILCSAFESWIICQHSITGSNVHPNQVEKYIKQIFGNATLGNSCMAILAGVIAQKIADRHGYIAPFHASAGVLVVCGVAIYMFWEENFGNIEASNLSQIKRSLKIMSEDRHVLTIGLVQALFESSMYCFVLEWTPALDHPERVNSNLPVQKLPHGTIFASCKYTNYI